MKALFLFLFFLGFFVVCCLLSTLVDRFFDWLRKRSRWYKKVEQAKQEILDFIKQNNLRQWAFVTCAKDISQKEMKQVQKVIGRSIKKSLCSM